MNDTYLSKNAARMLNFLTEKSDKKFTGNSDCATICGAIGISRATFYRIKKELIGKGLVSFSNNSYEIKQSVTSLKVSNESQQKVSVFETQSQNEVSNETDNNIRVSNFETSENDKILYLSELVNKLVSVFETFETESQKLRLFLEIDNINNINLNNNILKEKFLKEKFLNFKEKNEVFEKEKEVKKNEIEIKTKHSFISYFKPRQSDSSSESVQNTSLFEDTPKNAYKQPQNECCENATIKKKEKREKKEVDSCYKKSLELWTNYVKELGGIVNFNGKDGIALKSILKQTRQFLLDKYAKNGQSELLNDVAFFDGLVIESVKEMLDNYSLITDKFYKNNSSNLSFIASRLSQIVIIIQDLKNKNNNNNNEILFL